MGFSWEFVVYSIRNVWKNKFRSGMTVLSIFIGISTVFLFVSFGLGLYDSVQSIISSSSADKVIIQAKGIGSPGMDTTFRLTDDDIKAVERSRGVYEATGIYASVARVEYKSEVRYVYLSSYDPEEPLLLDFFNVGVAKGRFLKKGDKSKALFGSEFGKKKGAFSGALDVNDRVFVNGRKIRVVGILDPVGNPEDDSSVILTNDFYEEIIPNASYAMIIAKIDSGHIEDVVEGIEKNLRKERGLEKGQEDFFVKSFKDLMDSYLGALNLVVGFVVLIALVSIFVSAINTANTMITSVLERYKEIGVLKAIGARNSDVFYLFLFESVFLGFFAGVMGVLFGYGVSVVIGKILLDLGWGILQPSSPWWVFLGGVLFAVFTGAVSGVAPAMNASKINTVDALRYE